jgi:hypothetical protein
MQLVAGSSFSFNGGKMAHSIQENAQTILKVLAEQPRNGSGAEELTGEELAVATQLSPPEINDAVAILVEAGFVEWLQVMGTAPYTFGAVSIAPRGRYEYERLASQSVANPTEQQNFRPLSPVGSPFGFNDEDWEVVSAQKSKAEILYVVLGHQWESDYFDSAELRRNVEDVFLKAINVYNGLPGAIPLHLKFQSLAAGYGEHLFNQIARDIIGADIAVFETSDLNPNVMLEMGVALTWGTRVLPIKRGDCPRPPSDISGQTWADYEESGRRFLDPDYIQKIVEMIKRAIRKKGTSA